MEALKRIRGFNKDELQFWSAEAFPFSQGFALKILDRQIDFIVCRGGAIPARKDFPEIVNLMPDAFHRTGNLQKTDPRCRFPTGATIADDPCKNREILVVGI